MTEWRDVPEWEGLYQVSSEGEVRSLDRTTFGRRRAGRVLRQDDGGRYNVICLSRDGEQVRVSVHLLVLAAFVGPRPEGQEARHGVGGARDNSAGNLCYGTHSENAMDSVAHGTHRSARKTHCPQGHQLVDPGYADGHRMCPECKADQKVAYRARRDADPARRAAYLAKSRAYQKKPR